MYYVEILSPVYTPGKLRVVKEAANTHYAVGPFTLQEAKRVAKEMPLRKHIPGMF